MSHPDKPGGRVLPALNMVAKVALVLLLLHAVAFPDLPQYQGKGIGWRILLYPVSALIVPAVWWIRRRGGRPLPAYPHLIDLCLVLPFLIDTAGNAANFYDSVVWWDDLMHYVTWVPWVVAVGLALRERYDDRLVVAGLTLGFGAVTHILWELMEYIAFIRNNPNELRGAYEDTMGDLTLSLLGSATGALLVATVLWSVNRMPARSATGA